MEVQSLNHWTAREAPGHAPLAKKHLFNLREGWQMMCKRHFQPQRGVKFVGNLPPCLLSSRIPQSTTPYAGTTSRKKWLGEDSPRSFSLPSGMLTCRVTNIRMAHSHHGWAPPPPTLSHKSTRMKADTSPLSDEWLSENDAVHTDRGLSGKGNGTPHQYSCLENPMDGGAW